MRRASIGADTPPSYASLICCALYRPVPWKRFRLMMMLRSWAGSKAPPSFLPSCTTPLRRSVCAVVPRILAMWLTLKIFRSASSWAMAGMSALGTAPWSRWRRRHTRRTASMSSGSPSTLTTLARGPLPVCRVSNRPMRPSTFPSTCHPTFSITLTPLACAIRTSPAETRALINSSNSLGLWVRDISL